MSTDASAVETPAEASPVKVVRGRGRPKGSRNPVKPTAPLEPRKGERAGWRDKILDLDALPQSVQPDGKPLALPQPADPNFAYFAVRLRIADHLADRGKVNGLVAVKLVEKIETTLCDPTPDRSRIYPTFPPGVRPNADLYEIPDRNTIVRAQCPDGELHPMYLMDAAAFGFGVTLPIQVPRRAWQHVEEDDVRFFEDPHAAAGTSHAPVVQVTLWCPVMDADPQNTASLRPHGEYLGNGEWNPYTQRKGNGWCPRCNTTEKRQFAAADISRRLKRG